MIEDAYGILWKGDDGNAAGFSSGNSFWRNMNFSYSSHNIIVACFFFFVRDWQPAKTAA